MSTRGLFSFRFNGQDYVTYHPSDSYPEGLGSWLVHFAQRRLATDAEIEAFGTKLEALEWRAPSPAQGRPCRGFLGYELLEGIAEGRITWMFQDPDLVRTCLDCEFAYLLDLDAGVLEFWNLPERIASFPLASISSWAVGIMACEQRR